MCFAAGSGRPQAATFISTKHFVELPARQNVPRIGWQKSTEKFSSKSTIDSDSWLKTEKLVNFQAFSSTPATLEKRLSQLLPFKNFAEVLPKLRTFTTLPKPSK